MQTARQNAIAKYGLQTMYCDHANGHLETWTYCDGQRHSLRSFITLEGVQSYAKRHGFGIIYTDEAKNY